MQFLESLGGYMKKVLGCFLAFLMLVPCALVADENDQREEERVKESGEVMKEILNIPDDIPQDLLDKAECVVVLPSVKKGALGVGLSYGSGVMI
jgi:lipid-binding SYLF domain-containing protein